jgi:hypothetical protein
MLGVSLRSDSWCVRWDPIRVNVLQLTRQDGLCLADVGISPNNFYVYMGIRRTVTHFVSSHDCAEPKVRGSMVSKQVCVCHCLPPSKTTKFAMSKQVIPCNTLHTSSPRYCNLWGMQHIKHGLALSPLELIIDHWFLTIIDHLLACHEFVTVDVS